MIMRAEWEVPLSVICKLRLKKASNVIQSKFQEGLRIRGGKGVNISPRTE